MTEPGSQVSSDRRLLVFDSYEDYLDSLLSLVDLGYVEDLSVARRLAELGFRCTGETLTRAAFHRRWKAVKELLYPVQRPYELSSEYGTCVDPVMRELGIRERSNRLGVLSTVVFLRYLTGLRFEVSGYIDYACRLTKENWLPYFEGRKKLRPVATDLAYYYWRTGRTRLNVTDNYQPIVDPGRGLLFKHVKDKQLVDTNPAVLSPGVDTTRTRVRCPEYGHVILYDHVVRSRI